MVVDTGMQPMVVVEADVVTDCTFELVEGTEGLAADPFGRLRSSSENISSHFASLLLPDLRHDTDDCRMRVSCTRSAEGKTPHKAKGQQTGGW